MALVPGPYDESIAALLQAAGDHGIDPTEALELAKTYAHRDGATSIHIVHAAEAIQTLSRRLQNLEAE